MFYIAIIFMALSESSALENTIYPTCASAGMYCYDCYSQKQCLDLGWFGGLQLWSVTQCGVSLTSGEIYCDPATQQCSSVKPADCPSKSSYQCIRPYGILPDAGDCAKFHYCYNSTADDYSCAAGTVYKQQYGKCVFKLTDADCVTVNSCPEADFTSPYPGDPSIYYGCVANVPFVKACAKESDVYNLTTKSCESVCAQISTSTIPNTRNCSQYFQCDGTAATVVECPPGQGFNPSSQRCDPIYSELCNELSMLEGNFYGILNSNPITQILAGPISFVLNLFNISPANVIFLFGIPSGSVSNVILIADYVLDYQTIPPGAVGYVVDAVLQFLPADVRNLVRTLLDWGIISFDAPSDRKTEPLDGYVASVVADARLDVGGFLKSIEGKTNDEVNAIVFRGISRALRVDRAHVPNLAAMFRYNMGTVADTLNRHFGFALFASTPDGLKFNGRGVDVLIYRFINDASAKLYPTDYMMREIFKFTSRQQYLQHYKEVHEFVDAYYFNVDNLI